MKLTAPLTVTNISNGVKARCELHWDGDSLFFNVEDLANGVIVLTLAVDRPACWNDRKGAFALDVFFDRYAYVRMEGTGIGRGLYDSKACGPATTELQKRVAHRAYKFARRAVTTGLSVRSLNAQVRELAALGKALI